MSKSIHTQKHMTLSDRIYIEQALSNHDSFKDIAAVLKKDPSTISKEIRKHRRPKDGSHYHLKTFFSYFKIKFCHILNIIDLLIYHDLKCIILNVKLPA